MNRPICPICTQRPVAINRRIGDRVYYRKLCDNCIRQGKKLKPIPPGWLKAGYRKKDRCDVCGFKAKYPVKQLRVYYIDGNLKNNSHTNLKTVCLNCQVDVNNSKLPWKPSDLTPDF